MKHRHFIAGVVVAAGALATAGGVLAQGQGMGQGMGQGQGMGPGGCEGPMGGHHMMGGHSMMGGMMGGDMRPPMMTFEELDANGDGQVTKEEIQASAQARFKTHFDAVDTDGNGTLSLEEMQAQARKMADERAAQMFKQMDANADGAVSPDEMPGPRRGGDMMDRMFGRADADNSGSLSKEEFDAARARMQQRMEQRAQKDKGNMRQRMGGDCYGPGRGAQPMQKPQSDN